jgi:hypothetical protein
MSLSELHEVRKMSRLVPRLFLIRHGMNGTIKLCSLADTTSGETEWSLNGSAPTLHVTSKY